MKTRNIVIIAVLAILAILAGAFLFVQNERATMAEEQEAIAREQQQAMQEELAVLSEEFALQQNKLASSMEQNFLMTSDSLMAQLSSERTKVERLMEELKTTRAASSARIAELTREVSSLRGVLRSYVVQIDSLNTANERLRAENKAVKERFDRATTEVRQLATERTQLAQRVHLAAKLDATAIAVSLLDKRGKASKRIDRIENIQISFRIAKNITAEVGEKTFYTRIMRPDDEPMIKSGAGTFLYEGKQIPYSTRRVVEYNGEETPITMYWPVEESLQSGTYLLMIFADGNLIGSSSFSI